MANLAKYSLSEGFLHHWLLAGPFRSTNENQAAAYSRSLTQQNRPVELERMIVEGEDVQWKYLASKPDHWVDLTDQTGLEAWGMVEIHCPQVTPAQVILTSFGPAEVWIAGERVVEIERYEAGRPISAARPVELNRGANQVFVRFTRSAAAPEILAAAVRLTGCSDCMVMLPTASPMLANRKDLEKAFNHAYLDRYVYAEKDPIILRWQKDYPNHCKLAVQMRRSSATIFGYNPQVTAGAENELVLFQPFEVPDGAYNLRLMPNMEIYTENKLRIQRDIPFFTTKNKYAFVSSEPIGDRVDEVVTWAVQRVDDFFGQAIKMAAGRWKLVDFAQIERLLDQPAHTPLILAGLAGMYLRYSLSEPFPQSLRSKMISTFQNLVDIASDTPAAAGEGDEICTATYRLLVGQEFPKQTFKTSGKTGQWHARRARPALEKWIQQRLALGFQDWNDSGEIEKVLFALTLLVDFSSDEGLKEYAGVLLDKLFFHLAVHQFRGTPGSPRLSTTLPQGLNGRFDPLTPIARLMWGQGAPNIHLAGTAALLSVRSYVLPELIRQIALDESDCWMKECHTNPITGSEANIATYKTRDYLLSSVQDYQPGNLGITERIWQATLSPDAVVFTSHPLRFGVGSAGMPDFWCGNHSLPRVAQWKNTLMAVYALPEDDWAQFTHAYFPALAFDEYEITSGWAFARQGNAYLALTASQGLQWVTTGDSAYRELRTYGRENVWLCHLGRQAVDGSFAEFCENLMSAEVLHSDVTVFHIPGSDRLEFGWKQPLRVNGEVVELTNFSHYHTPYSIVEKSAPQMDIRLGEDSIRLNFAS